MYAAALKADRTAVAMLPTSDASPDDEHFGLGGAAAQRVGDVPAARPCPRPAAPCRRETRSFSEVFVSRQTTVESVTSSSLQLEMDGYLELFDQRHELHRPTPPAEALRFAMSGAISTTVTSLPARLSPMAHSTPTEPAPTMTVLSPGFTLPVSASGAQWTWGLSMPGSLGHDGLRSDGDDERLVAFGVEHLLGRLGVQEYARRSLLRLPQQVVEIVLHVLLERQRRPGDDVTAQMIALLVESDVMPALAERQQGLDAGGAAADDRDLLLDVGLLDLAFRELGLVAQVRVHGAVDDRGDHQTEPAVLAAQAGTVVVLPAEGVLARHLGVGQERPAHGHHVGLAGGDDLLGAARCP